MEITKTFVLHTPADVAWTFLTDPGRVASCLPGAKLTERRDENTHAGTITVKVGPVAATYKGTMKFDRLDPVARTAEITAAGQDVRGRGGAEMHMTSRLVQRGDAETEVNVVSQVNVMGVLAQFGRGMIQDVSDEMFQKFVDAMRAQLEAPAAPAGAASETGASAPATTPAETAATPPIDLLVVGSSALGRAVVRALGRPALWMVVAGTVAGIAGYRYLRR